MQLGRVIFGGFFTLAALGMGIFAVHELRMENEDFLKAQPLSASSWAGARLGSDDLATTLGAPPGCAITLQAGHGYGAVAVPPPFTDDPPEQIAWKEAIISRLQASIEVAGECLMPVEGDGEGDRPRAGARPQRTGGIFAIAVERGRDGRWRALAWRRMFGEDTGCR